MQCSEAAAATFLPRTQLSRSHLPDSAFPFENCPSKVTRQGSECIGSKPFNGEISPEHCNGVLRCYNQDRCHPLSVPPLSRGSEKFSEFQKIAPLPTKHSIIGMMMMMIGGDCHP